MKTIFDDKYRRMIEDIKNLRKSKGLSQRDLAKKFGVTHCYIGRVETCERRLDIIETINLLKTLELSESEIEAFIAKLL